MYKLVISDDEGHTTVVPLLRDEVTIGRTEGNTIRLTERNVSRHHARLLKRNQSYIIEDLGSYNGVTVNGARIDERAPLSAGDQLGIGDYGLEFHAEVIATANTMPSPKPKSDPPARLVVLSEPATGAEFTLNKPALRIGRDENLDIWINHKSISHEHAEVQVIDGKVSVYDLDSANGMRVNGIQTSRAVLENGDTLQLGEVRFRFVPPQGAHSLAPLPDEAVKARGPSPSRKPAFVVALLALLLIAGAGAVFVTMRAASEPGAIAESPSRGEIEKRRTGPSEAKASSPPAAPSQPETAEPSGAAQDADVRADSEPQEWERQLSRARRALAKGRFDRAFAIANELPADSVLRKTPEFGEIRYRYAQAHIVEGERAIEEGDSEQAIREARLVLELQGATPKQRQEARRLIRKAEAAQGRRIVD